MATNNPKNLSHLAKTLKNNRKSSKIKNLLLKMRHLNQKY